MKLLLSILPAIACLTVQAAETGIRISTVATNGMPRDIIPRKSDWNFGAGSLWTHKGWQYAAYWDDKCQVSVARRQLPEGDWSVVSLPGYQRTETGDRGKGGAISRGFGDGHEKVAMGISPDGFIHLSFDHHLSTLRYRTRVPFDLTTLERIDRMTGERETRVTYPTFLKNPSGKWHIQQLSDWDFRWDFSGPGSQVKQLSLGQPTPDSDGNLLVEFTTKEAGSGVWKLNPETLAPIATLPAGKSDQVPGSETASSTFPGIGVRTLSSQSGGTVWTLRWETLGPNRDLENRSVPPPSELRLFESAFTKPAKQKTSES